MGHKRVILLVVAALAVLSAGLMAIEPEPTAAPANPWPNAPEGAVIRETGWFAPPQPTVPSPQPPAEVTKAFIIPIKGAIRQTLADAIRRKVAICKGKGAQLVLFDIDTPGGSSKVMDEICQVISEDLADITTVAYVEREAMSAGAIISLSCDAIIMREATLIGDAMPIMVGPDGSLQPLPEAERAKIEEYYLGQVRVIAEQRGRSIPLCEGMVSIGIEVWLIRHTETDELKLINPDDKNWRRQVRQAPGTDVEVDVDASWLYVDTIDSNKRLVTLTALEAYGVGLCDLIVSDRRGALDHFNVTGDVQELTDTWSEQLVALLTSPAVTGVLLAVGILGAYVEFRTPGFGVGGSVAIACFAMVFGARYLTGLAAWWEIALILVGCILILLEVAVIPGFGVAGVSGILCLLVGLVATMISNAPDEMPIPHTEMDWSLLQGGFFGLCMGAVLALVGAALLTKYLPKVPVLNRLMLASAPAYTETTASPDSPLNKIAAGDVGKVESPCRPVGRARFGDDLVDVITEGDVIETGATIRVLHRDGNHVVVEKTDEA